MRVYCFREVYVVGERYELRFVVERKERIGEILMDNNARKRKKPFVKHRLPFYDYRKPGAYFVTICTPERQPYFEIPELAAILQRQWEDLPRRFPTVELDRFVLMPDHLHFILWLKPGGDDRPTLSKVVQAYKSLSALEWLRYVEEKKLRAQRDIWQRGFYDSIIHDQTQLENIRLYIDNNPIAAQSLENMIWTRKME